MGNKVTLVGVGGLSP